LLFYSVTLSQESLGVHPTSVEILKGYMARERFGTSGLGNGETSISERAKKVNNHSQQVGAPIANGRNRQTSWRRMLQSSASKWRLLLSFF